MALRVEDSPVAHQQNISCIMASNSRLRDHHKRSKWIISYGTHSSVANCLNNTGRSKVSFISLFPYIGSSRI